MYNHTLHRLGRLPLWILASGVAGGSGALAHGPAPAVIGVAAGGAEGPRVLQLSAGLAVRDDLGWRYLCGSAWGGPEAPPAVSGDGETTWIAAEHGLRTLTGGVVADAGGAVDAATAVALASSGGAAWALARRDGESWLWRLGGDAPLWHDPDPTWTGFVAHGGGFAVARVGADGLHVLTLSAVGVAQGESVFADVGSEATATLRSAAGALFVLLRDGVAQDLRRVDGDALVAVANSDGPVLGPVTAGDGAVLVIGGALLRLEVDVAALLDATHTYTCLAEAGGQAFACAQRDLYVVGDDGVMGPVASVGDVLPPAWASLAPSTSGECEAEWSDFASEAALPRVLPASDVASDAAGPGPGSGAAASGDSAAPASTPAAAGGCRTGAGAATPWAVGLSLLVAWWTSRSRSRGKRLAAGSLDAVCSQDGRGGASRGEMWRPSPRWGPGCPGSAESPRASGPSGARSSVNLGGSI